MKKKEKEKKIRDEIGRVSQPHVTLIDKFSSVPAMDSRLEIQVSPPFDHGSLGLYESRLALSHFGL